MSVSQQRQFVSRRASVHDDLIHASPDALRQRVLHDVLAAGRREAGPAVTTQAVLSCWQWLVSRSTAQRLELHEAIRAAIAAGRTTSRAWLPLAVAETDPALLRAAVTGYVGSTPCSAAHWLHVIDDVTEWFRRGLTLDRVAVFEALLALREREVNARLVALRGRLTDAERERVLGHFADDADVTIREFLDDWANDHPAPGASPQPG